MSKQSIIVFPDDLPDDNKKKSDKSDAIGAVEKKKADLNEVEIEPVKLESITSEIAFVEPDAEIDTPISEVEVQQNIDVVDSNIECTFDQNNFEEIIEKATVAECDTINEADVMDTIEENKEFLKSDNISENLENNIPINNAVDGGGNPPFSSGNAVAESGSNRWVSLLLFVLIPLAIAISAFYMLPSAIEMPFVFRKKPVSYIGFINKSGDEAAATIAKLEKNIRTLKVPLESVAKSQSYIIINTTTNKFRLYRNNQMVREGVCSTGRNEVLTKGSKSWVFKTPRGVHSVKVKGKNPVWVKPDWAFHEEGLPVPSGTHPSRYEPNVLGDYKMELGDGYMIHGTLFQRFLGLGVTHGCIRLGDDDLEAVYKSLEKGSKVYIY